MEDVEIRLVALQHVVSLAPDNSYDIVADVLVEQAQVFEHYLRTGKLPDADPAPSAE
jgi:hypothetical protein